MFHTLAVHHPDQYTATSTLQFTSSTSKTLLSVEMQIG